MDRVQCRLPPVPAGSLSPTSLGEVVPLYSGLGTSAPMSTRLRSMMDSPPQSPRPCPLSYPMEPQPHLFSRYTKSEVPQSLALQVRSGLPTTSLILPLLQQPSSLPRNVHRLESLPPQSTAGVPSFARSSSFSLAANTSPYQPGRVWAGAPRIHSRDGQKIPRADGHSG